MAHFWGSSHQEILMAWCLILSAIQVAVSKMEHQLLRSYLMIQVATLVYEATSNCLFSHWSCLTLWQHTGDWCDRRTPHLSWSIRVCCLELRYPSTITMPALYTKGRNMRIDPEILYYFTVLTVSRLWPFSVQFDVCKLLWSIICSYHRMHIDNPVD